MARRTALAGDRGASAQPLDELFEAEPDRLSRADASRSPGSISTGRRRISTRRCSTRSSALAEAAGFARRARCLVRGRDRQSERGPRRRACRRARAGRARRRSTCAAARHAADARAGRRDRGAARSATITGILHIGIGGSALGPELLVDALGRDAGRYDVAVLSNIDGEAFDEAVGRLRSRRRPWSWSRRRPSPPPRRWPTLRCGARLAGEAGVEDPYGRVDRGHRQRPRAAVEVGIDETRILPFGEGVGGRYSLWSSVGFPAALALGWDGVRGTARRRGGDGPPFPLRRAARQCAAARRLRRPLYAKRPRLPDARRLRL